MSGAVLIGCSGGSNKPAEDVGTGLKIVQPKNTSAQAKRGGIYKSVASGDITNLDPLSTTQGAGFGGPVAVAFSRILQEEVVATGEKPKGSVMGDLAESWELADGGLRLTVKLRTDAKFDPRPPTNGRLVDADDVVYSLERFFAQSNYKTQLSNKADPSSPIESATKVDNRTVVYKMAFPWSPLLGTMASGSHLIQPREAEDKFDPRIDIRASGPWMLDSYERSVALHWKRNPNYYRKDVPYLDGYDEPIVAEYASRLAQFRTKNIYAFTPNADEVLSLARDLPQTMLYQDDLDVPGRSIAFGNRPNSPFKDIRLRRAVSLAIDRDLFSDVDSGNDRFRAEGVPQQLFLDSHLTPNWTQYWLDPKGKTLGDASQYFSRNVAEAKKLIAAAGFPTGLEVDAPYDNRGVHCTEKQATIYSDMLAEAGFKLKLRAVDYQTIFLPQYWVSGAVKGDYEGLTFGTNRGRQPHIATQFYISEHSKGSFTASRRFDDGLDKIDSLIEQSAKEFDDTKLTALVTTIQKELGNYMSGVPVSYGRFPFSLVWPWVQNRAVYTIPSRSTNTGLNYVWIDETKRG